MTDPKVLVFGGTGPAGICLLRELIHRDHATIVYARNPSKIPADVASNPLIEIVEGEMSDLSKHATVMDQFSIVISLLGPNINNHKFDPTVFADQYKSSIFPLMRQRSVRRILAMCTLSVSRPEDHWTFFSFMVQIFMRLLARTPYTAIHNVADIFTTEAKDLDWTLFRLASIPGESDEQSWRTDREDGKTFAGWIGGKGWTTSIKRGALARWLVDAAEGSANEWVGKMPAVSRLG